MIRLADVRPPWPAVTLAIRSPHRIYVVLIAALHGVDQPPEHALVTRLPDGRTSDVADVAAAACRNQRKPDERRETGAAVRIGQAGDLLWPAYADRPSQHALHVICDILKLGATAGQHDLASDGTSEAEAL